MGGDDGGGRGIEREYRRRRRLSWRKIAVMVVVGANCVLQLTVNPAEDGLWPRLVLSAILLASLGSMLLFGWRGRTIVGPGGITARGAVRTVTRTWHSVYDIRAEPNPAGPTDDSKWVTYLYGIDGRRILLPYVDDWQLPDFHTEFAGLRTTAALHRGTAWDPRPETETLIRRRARHRTTLELTCVAAAVALLGTLVFLA
ncbi:PH domain-containing protein [Streptomyces sp. NPDC005492]|uniref:PH domain-containing protein n=1 Tax=Streptomyces sp. NPDC005492 TaxID=3156883 RepID=UPI0033B6E7F7